MIVFCEDCGSKNRLVHQSAATERLVFTCMQCGYPNDYAVSGKPVPGEPQTCQSAAGQFDRLPGAISTLPEIAGAFVFRQPGELLGFKMPQSLSKRNIAALGNLLSQAYEGPKQAYNGVKDMVMVMEKKAVLVKFLDRSVFLVVVAGRFPLPASVMAELNRLVSGYGEKKP